MPPSDNKYSVMLGQQLQDGVRKKRANGMVELVGNRRWIPNWSPSFQRPFEVGEHDGPHRVQGCEAFWAKLRRADQWSDENHRRTEKLTCKRRTSGEDGEERAKQSEALAVHLSTYCLHFGVPAYSPR